MNTNSLLCMSGEITMFIKYKCALTFDILLQDARHDSTPETQPLFTIED